MPSDMELSESGRKPDCLGRREYSVCVGQGQSQLLPRGCLCAGVSNWEGVLSPVGQMVIYPYPQVSFPKNPIGERGLSMRVATPIPYLGREISDLRPLIFVCSDLTLALRQPHS